MANDVHQSWKILNHGPLERLADNLWRVKGSLPGMSLERVMTVVRRSNGALLLHSVIALNEAAMRELEALGPIVEMLVPNAGHRLDSAAYKRRYPGIRVYCPPGGREKIAEVVPVDGTYLDFPSDDSVRLEVLDGLAGAEGAMIVRSADGLTVVLNDTVMNMDRKRDILGFLYTTIMGSAPGPRVSRAARLLYVKDQPALRSHLLRLAELPDLRRLIVSHEKVAFGDAAPAALRRAATFLRRADSSHSRSAPGTPHARA
jgi:hypothetical protein